MNAEPAFLLTGATGFLGGRVLGRLLREGAKVIVLIRGGRGPDERRISAQARASDLLAQLNCTRHCEQLAVIESDIADIAVESLADQLAVALTQLGATQLVAINVAASLKMEFAGQNPAKREATRLLNQRTNVEGLNRLLNALDRLDAKSADAQPVLQSMVHFSTCYAHGQRTGLLPEEALIPDFGTENSYEQSKRDGESCLNCWQSVRVNRIPVTVIRPSIVTGPDTRDGYLAWLDIFAEPFQINRLSGWMRRLVGIQAPQARLMDVMAAALRRLHIPFVPLLGNSQGVLDFIDAGDVEKYSWLVIQRHRTETLAPGLRYLHLANPQAPTLAQVADLTFSAFGHADLVRRLKFIRGFWLFAALLRLFAAVPMAGRMMRGMHTRTSMLRPYLMRSSGTRFDTRSTAAYFAEIGIGYETRPIDVEYVRSLIAPLPPASPERIESATTASDVAELPDAATA